MRPARGPVGGAVAVLGLLLLSGCGEAPPTEPAPAAAATTPATTPAPTLRPADPAVAEFVERVLGAARAAGTAELSLVSGGPGAEVVVGTGVVRFGDHATDLHVRVPGPDDARAGDLETIAVDGVAYTSAARLEGGLFVRAEPDTPEFAAGLLLGGIPLRDVDPLHELTADPAAVLRVVAVGTPEQVDGVRTQAYDVTVDQRSRMWRPSDGTGDLVRPPEAELDALDPETYEAVRRYWVDDSGLLRKVSGGAVLGDPAEIRLSGWGTDVEITAPPPDRVLDADDFTPTQLPAGG